MIGIIVIFSLLLIWTIIHWLYAPSDYDKKPFPSVSLFLCIVPLTLAIWYENKHRVMVANFERVASEIAGREAKVECETLIQSFMPKFLFAEGFVEYQGKANKMFLREYACRNLNKAIKNPDPENRYYTFALAIFVHETMHIKGIRNEAQTECYAMQYMSKAGQLFRLSQQQAHALARSYWKVQYDMRSKSDFNSEYYSVECRKDGAFDLHLSDAPWD